MVINFFLGICYYTGESDLFYHLMEIWKDIPFTISFLWLTLILARIYKPL